MSIYKFLHNLLNVVLQIANEMRLQNRKYMEQYKKAEKYGAV
jgi:hypothetical protein